jgi:hypothetical protein
VGLRVGEYSGRDRAAEDGSSGGYGGDRSGSRASAGPCDHMRLVENPVDGRGGQIEPSGDPCGAEPLVLAQPGGCAALGGAAIRRGPAGGA